MIQQINTTVYDSKIQSFKQCPCQSIPNVSNEPVNLTMNYSIFMNEFMRKLSKTNTTT